MERVSFEDHACASDGEQIRALCEELGEPSCRIFAVEFTKPVESDVPSHPFCG